MGWLRRRPMVNGRHPLAGRRVRVLPSVQFRRESESRAWADAEGYVSMARPLPGGGGAAEVRVHPVDPSRADEPRWFPDTDVEEVPLPA